jgi:hypothetical protein
MSAAKVSQFYLLLVSTCHKNAQQVGLDCLGNISDGIYAAWAAQTGNC